MEFTGKIIAVLEKKKGVAKSSGKEWCVQEFVIENNDQYPKKMCFEVFGEEKIDQFKIAIGKQLTVSFDIDARQWQDRWFNSIRVWRVQNMDNASEQLPNRPAPKVYDDPSGVIDFDGLPF